MRSFRSSTTGAIVTPQKKRVKSWRGLVADAAMDAMKDGGLWEGALSLTARIFMVRPKSHYRIGRNAHLLKPSAPWAPHGNVGDLSKFVRAVEDAMTGVVYHDDCQIVHEQLTKLYGERPGVQVTVEEIHHEPLPF